MMDVKEQPFVSVIMPAYNAERFIRQAIESVQSQTFIFWELLVIDDGSSDGTCAVVQELAEKDMRIRLIRNEKNIGVARTRNAGIDLAQGEMIAFLDSDDYWYPEKLEKQLYLAQQTGADAVYCSYMMKYEDGSGTEKQFCVPQETDFEQMLSVNVMSCSTALVSGKAIGEQRFHPDYYHEDYVFWLELLKKCGRAVGCEEAMAVYRVIPDSRSFNKWNSAKNRWRVYRSYLKLPLGKSLRSFADYCLNGVKKYHR